MPQIDCPKFRSNAVWIALGSLLVLACVPATSLHSKAPSVHPSDKDLVDQVLDDWHAAAAKADLERYFGHLADDAIFLGTDAKERWTKEQFLAYSRPIFAKGKAWTFVRTRRAVVVHTGGLVAHFDEDLSSSALGPIRGSGVLVLRDGRWRIQQYNLAITVPNERFAATREAAGGTALLGDEGGAKTSLNAVTLLSGSWVGRTVEGDMEEHWTNLSGGSMIGMGRAVAGGKTRFFESLRIEIRPGGQVVYIAQPRGGPATEFALVTPATQGKLVFANPLHDYPKQISYTWRGGRLNVELSGSPGQPVKRWALERAIISRADLP